VHIAYKHTRIKQYCKEERALRTETTFNDTYDFDIGRRLSNLSYLRTLSDHINRRVLETESLAHDCGLAPAQLADLVQPTRTPTGQPPPALKFGQPRVTAVLNALCHFLWTADGLTNAQLRPLIASLLGTPNTPTNSSTVTSSPVVGSIRMRPLAREIDKQLLAGPVYLPHRRLEAAGPLPQSSQNWL
jgi:hypothetical protein